MIEDGKRKYFRLFRDELERIAVRPVRLMEVCGTHTMAIGRAGLRQVLPPQISLVSGPGCPVCVTADADIDSFLGLAKERRVTVATFGDMMRVPGNEGSLADFRAAGADIRVVYSPLEALELARSNPGQEIVFLGIGFETSAPGTAQAIIRAGREGLKNFSVYNLHKTVPQALQVLLDDPGQALDAFILPGHVSAIIGEAPYRFMPEKYGVGGAIAGFEPTDILAAIARLVKDINSGCPRITNLYGQVVRPGGNTAAQQILAETFEPCDADWRGLGMIPGSGLKLRPRYAGFDAALKFGVSRAPAKVRAGCRCGEVLKGILRPVACPLFGRTCTPEHPVGPCMVSSEGTCAAYYLYEGGKAHAS